MNHKLAAKAFIVNKKNELLIVKREPNNVMAPGMWELPGGRLEEGEDPKEGLKREIKEEAGIGIDIVFPFSTRHFTRVDGQLIDLTIYYCKPFGENITLSAEHTAYAWVPLEKAKGKLGEFFWEEIDLFEKIKTGKIFK